MIKKQASSIWHVIKAIIGVLIIIGMILAPVIVTFIGFIG